MESLSKNTVDIVLYAMQYLKNLLYKCNAAISTKQLLISKMLMIKTKNNEVINE